jgi:hypothetical protein
VTRTRPWTRVAPCWLALVATACQLTPTFQASYQFDRVSLRSTPPVGSLAVRKFDDARAPRRYAHTGKLFLLYIPLIPYISLDFERLEESVQIQSQGIEQSGRGITLGADQQSAGSFESYSYPASFARAIASDLDATGLFQGVHYADAGEAVTDRYLLTGTLRETPFTRSTTSFMLGMAGVLLWLLPVPMSKSSADVSVDVVLTDRAANQTVWRKTLHADVSRLITLYTSSAMVYGRSGAFSMNIEPPPSDSRVDQRSLFSWHFEALRRAMVEARPEIAQALSSYEATAKAPAN